MKVLQITASYKPAYVYGGPTMSVAKLSEQLKISGQTVEVFTTTANGSSELTVSISTPVQVDGVSVTYFKRLTKDHSHFSPTLLKALNVNVKRYDLVHIHAWWNTVSVLACCIALWHKIPVVVSPRGTLSSYSFKHRNQFAKKILHAVLSRILLSKCYIHATSLKEATDLLTIIKPKKIFNIPNFVKLASGSSLGSTQQTEPLKLIFLSRIDAKKRLELLFAALQQVHIPYLLTIAGNGNELYIDSLKALSVDYGLDKNIIWAGFQADEQKFELLSHHHVLVLTSYDENFGNVIIESLSVGTAVLISNQVGLADFVDQHKLGWVCPLDKNSISNTINQIPAQTKQLDSIRTQAPLIIRNEFSETALIEKYTSMYHQVVTGA